MASPMRVGTYSRVSTSDKGQNPKVQQEELRRYCAARGWDISIEVVDEGFSGGTDKRPGLKQLMSLARSRKIDVIAVVKLDRLFRSLKHLVTTLDELDCLGVRFISIQDQIDLTTASGRLMLHLLGAFGEFERALIRERTLMGLAHARRHGKRLGRPRTHDVDTLKALRAKGASFREIQRITGAPMGCIARALQTARKSPSKGLPAKDEKSGGCDE